MTFPRRISKLARALLVFALMLTPASTTSAQATPPEDFALFVQYGAGYSPWQSWLLTITANGTAVQETMDTVSGEMVKKTLTLTKADLEDLFAAVRQADFMSLAQDYRVNVTDHPTIIIRVAMDKTTHQVSVYAPGLLQDNAEVQRFLTVWNEVLKKVPSPNPEQVPE